MAKYAGYLDSIKNGKAHGWARNSLDREAVTVEILADGEVLGEARADLYREDLKLAGFRDGRLGFEIPLPAHIDHVGIIARIKGTGFTLIDNVDDERKRFVDRFQNSIVNGVPNVANGFSVHHVDGYDRKIADEVINLWRSMPLPNDRTKGSPRRMWEILEDENYASLTRPLEAEDVDGVADAFVDCAKTNVSYGMLQGALAYDAFKTTTNDGRNAGAAAYFDALLSFAQYLGVARLESPEQSSSYGSAIHAAPERVLQAVEQALNFSITPPQMLHGLFGIKTPRGILHCRDIQGLYLSHRTVVAAGGEAHVCEIGGGLGQAVYYAWQLGIRKYTVVDLPFGCLLQYFFLRRAIPDATITMAPKSGNVTIVPAHLFAGYKANYDIAINADSFPEMGDEVCQNYFNILSSRSRLLLSINQEANCPMGPDPNGARQSVVNELLGKHPSYSRLYRQRSWVRKGYAEELWRTGGRQGEED